MSGDYSMKVGILTMPPAQYRVPWLRALAETPGIDLTVFFCLIPDSAQQSDETALHGRLMAALAAGLGRQRVTAGGTAWKRVRRYSHEAVVRRSGEALAPVAAGRAAIEVAG